MSPPHPSTTSTDLDRLSPVEPATEANSNSANATVSESSAGSVAAAESKVKKSVRWREEKDLREYFYFEMLEDERGKSKV